MGKSSKVLKVKGPFGVHARPASRFCMAAEKWPGDVWVHAGGQVANGKSVLDVMAVIAASDSFTVVVEGDDAPEILETLVAILIEEGCATL